MAQRKEKCQKLMISTESTSKLGCGVSTLLSFFVYLSNHYDWTDENRENNNIIQITDKELMNELNISKYYIRKYRRDMKNKGIVDFQIKPSTPITYKINFPLIEKEYGYSPFVADLDFYNCTIDDIIAYSK